MKGEAINLPNAPALPFSAAIRAGDYIFVSGQAGFTDAKGGEVKGIKAQTKQCLENTRQVLTATNASLDDVVKVTVFLRNRENFAKMNEVYQTYFVDDKPARSTIIAGLALPSMLVEVECIAYSPQP